MSEDRYLVTARKYRPRRFGDLVAQQHVSDTLRNALVQDRLAHAYLFSGPRGVGKTTAARILGQAINCTTPLEGRDRGEPCGECEACASFQEGRNLNIIEIDAASNNSVDDVRALREKVRIPPQGGKKKVYIIDEVHMLSNQAFNALLKTLEEPPAHVLFIFATTEPNKVLPTILSRCQRFDFRRIAVPEIMDRLRYVSEEENVEYDEESLMLLAKRGNGALRDALSVFDQAVALCGTSLTYDELAGALGVVEVDLYFQVTERVLGGDSSGMIHLVEQITRAGHDLQEFLQGLSEHLRNLLVVRSTGSTELVQATDANRRRYEETAADFEESDLLRLLMIASEAASEVKSSPQPRLQVEMALLEMAHLERTADLQHVLERLEEVPDEEIGASRKSGASESPDDGPDEREGRDARDERDARSEHEAPSSGDAPPSETDSDGDDTRGGAATDVLGTPPLQDSPDASARADAQPTPSASGKVGEAELGGSSEGSRAPAPSGETAVAERPGDAQTEDAATSYADETADQAPDAEDCGSTEASPDDLDATIEEVWTTFLRRVKRERVSLGTCLQHARPGSITPQRVTVRVPDNFHRQTLSEESTYLLRELREAAETEVPPLAFAVDPELDEESEEEPGTSEDPFEHVKKLRDEDPVVRALFEQFGGDFVY